MKGITRMVPAVFLMALLFVCAGAEALQEQGKLRMDFTDSLRGFSQAVAQMNREGEEMAAGRKRGVQGPLLVLVRTDGREIPFPEDGLKVSAAGPEERYVLQYESMEKAEAAVKVLREEKGILYAETDRTVYATREEEDTGGLKTEQPAFHSSGAETMGFGPYLELTQRIQMGSVLVAVVDSGVSYHPLMDGRIQSGGYDYIDGDNDPTNDMNGHGTHVAGIVADCTIGTQVYIYPIRVLNAAASGKLSNVMLAVLEAAEVNADIINLSLESSIESEALEDAIRDAIRHGCVVVAAAGNSGISTGEITPGRMTEAGIIVVGSAEIQDGIPVRASYSNYGSSVDIYACGSDISACSRGGGYFTQSGTSMAAAHISAACAMMRLTGCGGSAEQMVSRLQAVAMTGNVQIPNLARMVPMEAGFSLTSIRMTIGETVILPGGVWPETAYAPYTYAAEDDTIITVGPDGALTALATGESKLTVRCRVYETQEIHITVVDESGGMLECSGVTEIGEEAFAGTGFTCMRFNSGLERIGNRAFADNLGLRWVSIPDSVTEIGQDILDGSENTYLLCGLDCAVLQEIRENGIQYILTE